MFIAVSEKDKETYQQEFAAKDIEYLPVFLPFNKRPIKPLYVSARSFL